MADPARERVVLLDALGTLLELEPPGPRLVEVLQEDHGIELSLADAAKAFAKEIGYYHAHHLEGHGPPSLAGLRRRCAEVLHTALPARAAEAIEVPELEQAMLGALRFNVYADVPEVLATLNAHGVRVVVVSNWDAALPRVLRDAGVALGAGGLGDVGSGGLGRAGWVDGVVTSAAVGAAKPDPRVFHAALALAGVSARRALHVGDSLEHDVAGARAAGVAAVWLCRGEPPAQARTPAGVPRIASLAELPALV